MRRRWVAAWWMVDLCEITSGTPSTLQHTKKRGEGPNGHSAEPQIRVVGWTRKGKTKKYQYDTYNSDYVENAF